DLIDAMNPTPDLRFWCWKVTNADTHPFAGDLAALPTLDPAGCGFAGAVAWQREQRADVTFPNGAPINTLEMDFSTSSTADPGAPRGTSPQILLRNERRTMDQKAVSPQLGSLTAQLALQRALLDQIKICQEILQIDSSAQSVLEWKDRLDF